MPYRHYTGPDWGVITHHTFVQYVKVNADSNAARTEADLETQAVGYATLMLFKRCSFYYFATHSLHYFATDCIISCTTVPQVID